MHILILHVSTVRTYNLIDMIEGVFNFIPVYIHFLLDVIESSNLAVRKTNYIISWPIS